MRKMAPMSSDHPTGKSSLLPLNISRQYEEASHAYFARFRQRLLLTDLAGKIWIGKPYKTGGSTEKERSHWRALAISEALRWGQPSMVVCPDDHMIWGVPITENNKIIAGMVVKPRPFYDENENPRSLSEKLTEACEALLSIAEKYNLTNKSLLKLNRISAFVEREKAEAIHESKKKVYSDLRELYLLEEASLLSAIQRSDAKQARAIINRILLHIYSREPRSLNLLKSFSIELIVMMSRTAVDTGVDATRIMGLNSSFFSNLTRIDDEEELSHWIKSTLERLIEEIQNQQSKRHQERFSKAIFYIQNHLAENFGRDDVARYCGLSPGHFSHLVHDETGKTFSEWVSFYRVRHACQLLARNQQSLAEISLECGFSDQSYFTKIFYRLTGQKPFQYRNSLNQPSPGK